MFKKVKTYFYTGLIALLPLILTVFVFNFGVTFVTKILSKTFIIGSIKRLLSKVVNETEFEFYFDILVYLISIIVVIVGICFVGFILRIVFFAKIVKRIEGLFIKIPLVKQVYVTISQIIGVFTSNKKNTYKKVVMIEYPRKGIFSIGFLTSESNTSVKKMLNSDKNFCNIFIPTSPNPTSGMFIIVREDEVKLLNIKVEDAIKLIISGGVILPETVEELKEKS